MVGLNIKNHRNGGVKCVEGIVILAGLHYNSISPANPVARPQHGKRSAYHNCRVLLGRHEDVCAHGGGGGFPVCA